MFESVAGPFARARHGPSCELKALHGRLERWPKLRPVRFESGRAAREDGRHRACAAATGGNSAENGNGARAADEHSDAPLLVQLLLSMKKRAKGRLSWKVAGRPRRELRTGSATESCVELSHCELCANRVSTSAWFRRVVKAVVWPERECALVAVDRSALFLVGCLPKIPSSIQHPAGAIAREPAHPPSRQE